MTLMFLCCLFHYPFIVPKPPQILDIKKDYFSPTQSVSWSKESPAVPLSLLQILQTTLKYQISIIKTENLEDCPALSEDTVSC